ncbi:MAG: PilZ domain-containing protein [Deltaproteobacteria bacterium]|nr:PilZ domain-containing protein [Deltaproteobacteria bacterium]
MILSSLEIPRARVQPDGTIPATCPACGAEIRLSSKQISIRGRPFEVACSCGKHFRLFAEFRKAYRRPVSLAGTYAKVSSPAQAGSLVIKNMSMTGVGFAPEGPHRILKGDILMLRFVLDDNAKTTIEAPVVVAHARPEFVGCAFKDLSPEQEDALASYLIRIP